MPANTYGRQVVLPLTNKRGSGVIAGDVVVIDTTNNDAFTTDASGGFVGTVGIAQETIANNATGRVLLSGYAPLVNVNASVTRGHYGKTYTVAAQATDAGASRGVGTFCEFLTGGTTPDAIVYPVDLLGSSLTNPMTTTGDIIYGGASGTPTRLAAGTASQALVSGTTPSWTSAVGILQSAGVTRTAGDLTTTSTSFVDMTSMTVTLTTGARRCLVIFQASAKNSGASNTIFDVAVDGTLQGQTFGLSFMSGSNNVPVGFTFLTAVLSAGSHTIKMQWRVDAAVTGTVYASTGVAPSLLTVLETGLAT